MPRAKKTEKKEKTEKADPIEAIKSTTEELLQKLEITAGVDVASGEDDVYNVNVQTEESGILIGYHGETLASFQVILGLLVYRKLGQWVRVVVEVGDYRAKREEQLKAMAESWAAQAISSGQPVFVPFLPPGERRIVHLALQGRGDVETFSEGEGRNRRLVIKPRTS